MASWDNVQHRSPALAADELDALLAALKDRRTLPREEQQMIGRAARLAELVKRALMRPNRW